MSLIVYLCAKSGLGDLDQWSQRRIAFFDGVELLHTDEAIQAGKNQVHLAGHESPQPAQPKIIAVSLFKDLLCGVNSVESQICAIRNKSDVLETWKAQSRNTQVISSRIEDRSLEHGSSDSAMRLMSRVVSGDNVLKLVTILGFLVKRDESFKVKTATISRFVEGLNPQQSFQVDFIEFVPVTPGKFPERVWKNGVGHRCVPYEKAGRYRNKQRRLIRGSLY
jgi:hypothetical protein